MEKKEKRKGTCYSREAACHHTVDPKIRRPNLQYKEHSKVNVIGK